MLKVVVMGLFALLAVEACEDKQSSCPVLAKGGICTDSRFKIFASIFCRKSCKYCGCKDLDLYAHHCPNWARNGFCNNDSFKSFMSKYCQESCGLCGGVFPTTPQAPVATAGPVTGNCGRPDIQQGRVIAGVDAKKGAWPWQILMLFNGTTMCGGSLISPQWVVTAAHCVFGWQFQTHHFKVRVGEHITTSTSDGSHQDKSVEKIIVHRRYSRRTLDNDIALIKLATPVQFGRYVKPVCLPNEGQNVPVGTECYITGWGNIKYPGNMHHTLQQAKLPVISNAVCTNLNTKNLFIKVTDNMVCAGHGGTTRVVGCHGDSGGPFVCQTGAGGRWVLHGAVSWGSPRCNASDAYTVFARIAAYRSWIDQEMAQN